MRNWLLSLSNLKWVQIISNPVKPSMAQPRCGISEAVRPCQWRQRAVHWGHLHGGWNFFVGQLYTTVQATSYFWDREYLCADSPERRFGNVFLMGLGSRHQKNFIVKKTFNLKNLSSVFCPGPGPSDRMPYVNARFWFVGPLGLLLRSLFSGSVTHRSNEFGSSKGKFNAKPKINQAPKIQLYLIFSTK